MARNDPGSKSGIRKGCTCPPRANNEGRGIKTIEGFIVWMVEPTCPMHGSKEDEDSEEAALDRYLLPRA